LTLIFFGRELTVPAYLVVGVIVYSTAFTAMMIAVGRNLTSVIQAENQAEAELRGGGQPYPRNRGRNAVGCGRAGRPPQPLARSASGPSALASIVPAADGHDDGLAD
jgi:hypothetical protein